MYKSIPPHPAHHCLTPLSDVTVSMPCKPQHSILTHSSGSQCLSIFRPSSPHPPPSNIALSIKRCINAPCHLGSSMVPLSLWCALAFCCHLYPQMWLSYQPLLFRVEFAKGGNSARPCSAGLDTKAWRKSVSMGSRHGVIATREIRNGEVHLPRTTGKKTFGDQKIL